jgi:hypothetical protein
LHWDCNSHNKNDRHSCGGEYGERGWRDMRYRGIVVTGPNVVKV